MKKQTTIAIISLSLFTLISLMGVNVYAQITNVQIIGCTNRNGVLRIVTSNINCSKNESLITWNTSGPKGDKGDQGPIGPKGNDGLPGKDFLIPEPKTVSFVENKLITADGPNATYTSDWNDVSGGYNKISVNVRKTGGGGIDQYIRAVSVDFSNDPTNISEIGSQGRLHCSSTECDTETLPILAKYYRINFDVNSGIILSSYGYLIKD